MKNIDMDSKKIDKEKIIAALKRGADILADIILGIFGLLALYILLLVFVMDTFHAPSSSMTPTILPGDRGVINKLKLGPRLFDLKAAAYGEPFEIHRLPGYGQLERGDIIVFNSTFKERWDTVEMSMGRYYCKRAVAVAGDTLRVVNGYYRVNDSREVIGVDDEQYMMIQYLTSIRCQTPDSVPLPGWIQTHPYDGTTGWTIDNFGPMVIPGKGTTIALDRLNYNLYRKYIVWETGHPLSWHDERAWMDGRPLDEYTFTEDYCFAGGDHVIDSQDSRYWGLVPEKFIVGVVPFLFPRF